MEVKCQILPHQYSDVQSNYQAGFSVQFSSAKSFYHYSTLCKHHTEDTWWV